MLYHKEVIEKAMAFPIDKVIYRYQQQYCGHILGCLLINDAVIAKGFVLWTGFVQTLPIG